MGIWKTGREQGNALIIGKRYKMSQKRKWLKKNKTDGKKKRKKLGCAFWPNAIGAFMKSPLKGRWGKIGGIFVGSKVSLRDAFRSELRRVRPCACLAHYGSKHQNRALFHELGSECEQKT